MFKNISEIYLSNSSFDIDEHINSVFLKSMIYSLIFLLNYHRYKFELSDQEETILMDIISHFNQEQLTEERVVEKIIISWF